MDHAEFTTLLGRADERSMAAVVVGCVQRALPTFDVLGDIDLSGGGFADRLWRLVAGNEPVAAMHDVLTLSDEIRRYSAGPQGGVDPDVEGRQALLALAAESIMRGERWLQSGDLRDWADRSSSAILDMCQYMDELTLEGVDEALETFPAGQFPQLTALERRELELQVATLTLSATSSSQDVQEIERRSQARAAELRQTLLRLVEAGAIEQNSWVN
ncbi:hypothetical protein [Micromonospora avicenniae]|uniref:hypothetical protein n=1 Tax=Micromonospora avicenniae TaxID=1198245 RepID=UPI003324F764